MQEQKDVKKLVAGYLEEMNNYDPDLQQMGAKYLSELVLNDKINLLEDPDLARKITQNFLKQVASQSFAVHSSAIRFLAEMVPKLPKNQLIHIFHQTISAIAKVDTQPQRREIFSTSAGTMIHLAPEDFGHALSDLFVESINQLMNARTKNSDIEMLLLNVITEFTRKWPNIAGSHDVKFNRRGFIHHLLNNIEKSNKLLLIRKSDGALAKICLIFDKENFEFLFNEREIGLLNFIRKYQNSNDEDGLKQLRNGMMSLAHVVKGSNPEMKLWAKQITLLCIELIQNHKEKDTFPETTTEVIENSITCLNYILRAYSSEIQDLLSNENVKLYSFIEQMLDFDLEGMMTYVETGMDQEEDEYEGDEYNFSDDSICWKVRASALKYVATLLHKHQGFRNNKAKSQEFLNILSNKLIEENESVSRMAFESFNFIIESISVPKNATELEQQMGLKRVKSNERDFGLDIVSQISDQIKILFESKKTKQQIKTEASKTLLYIIELLKEIVKENEDIQIKLLDLVLGLIKKVNIDSCINMLRALRSLMSESLPLEKVDKVIALYLNYIRDKNLKIVSTSYSGLKTIEKVYGEVLARKGKFKPILDVILVKMREHDADKLIKVNVIKCLGPIFSNIFELLSEPDQNNILLSVQEKLQIQIDKGIILLQLSHLSNSYKMKKSQQKHFQILLQLSSQNLGSKNFQLNHNSIESCDRLIHIQASVLNDKVVSSLLQKCKPLLFDFKLPKFLGILIDNHPKAFKEYVDVIVRTAESQYIFKLIEKKITDAKSCIQILQSHCRPENSKKISVILSKLNVDEGQIVNSISDNSWGLTCLGALGYLGNLKTVQYLLNLVETSKSDEIKFSAARALGNIASRHPDLLTRLTQLSSKAQDGYLYIFAMKEMLHFSQKEFPQLPNLISFLFQKGEDNNRETNQYVIAESIGQVSRISPTQMKNILKSLPSMSEVRKCLVANSLRYAYEGKAPEDDFVSEDTQHYIKEIMNLTFDKSLNVKYGAMKSLNSIKYSYSSVIKDFISAKFVDQLLDSLLIKAQNIIIVDYGVNKEKKDLGKPLRIEAFNFLTSIMQFRILETKFEEIVGKSIDKMNEETSNDLILKRVHIIKKICQKDFTMFLPYEHEFEKKLGTDQGVLKAHQKQTTADDERNEGYLKSLLKEIIEIRAIADREGNEKIKAFIINIRKSERLNGYIEELEK